MMVSTGFGYAVARMQAQTLVLTLPYAPPTPNPENLPDYGGLGFDTHILGYYNILAAVASLLVRVYLFKPGMIKYGPHKLVIGAMILQVFAILPFPAVGIFADKDKFGFWRFVPMGIYVIWVNFSFSVVPPCIFIMING